MCVCMYVCVRARVCMYVEHVSVWKTGPEVRRNGGKKWKEREEERGNIIERNAWREKRKGKGFSEWLMRRDSMEGCV